MVQASGLVRWHVDPLVVHHRGAKRKTILAIRFHATPHELQRSQLRVHQCVVEMEGVNAGPA